MNNLLLLLAAGALAGPVPPTPLFQAAVTRAPELDIAQAEERTSEWQAKRSAAPMLPRIDSTAGLTSWPDARPAFPVGILRPGREAGVEVRAEQTLFQGGSLLGGYREAAALHRAAESQTKAAREEVLYRAAWLSFDWQERREALQYAEAENSRRQGHWEAARKRADAGVLSDADLRRAEAEAKKASADLIEAGRFLAETRHRLEMLTGLNLADGLSPPFPFPSRADRKSLAEAARLANPRTRAAFQTLEASRRAQAAADGRWAPALVAGAAQRGSIQTPETLHQVRRESYGYLQARWNLFGGGESLAASQGARAKTAAAKGRLQQTSDEAALSASLAFDAAEAALSVLEADEARVEAARTAYDRTAKRHEAGMDPYLNLLDSASTLRSAEAERTKARYARQRALLDLHRALGTVETALLGGPGRGE